MASAESLLLAVVGFADSLRIIRESVSDRGGVVRGRVE
jgi:hypothetical protein